MNQTGVRLLTQKAEIRAALREVTATGVGRRIVLAAYIGPDPLEYLADPRGIDVYCSDNPVGTDPDGVAALVEAGARVWFVDRLHAKLYWSQKAGALIGSPNLSTSALGEGGLFETVQRVNDIDIERVLKDLRRHAQPRLVDTKELDAFRRRARRARGIPGPRQRAKVPTFEVWLTKPEVHKGFGAVRSTEEGDELTARERKAVIAWHETNGNVESESFEASYQCVGSLRSFPAETDILCMDANDDATRIYSSGANWLLLDMRLATRAGYAGHGVRTRLLQLRRRRPDAEPFQPKGKLFANAMTAYFTRYATSGVEGVYFQNGSIAQRRLIEIGLNLLKTLKK